MDKSIGTEEQALLLRIAKEGSVTVGELAGPLRDERGWGRSTVQKMVDRLVAKQWLVRSREEGVYRYRSLRTVAEIEAEVMRQFVQTRFDGSVGPLVAFLHGGAQLTNDEISQLRELIDAWDQEK